MRSRLRTLWPFFKTALTLAILFTVGPQFVLDLLKPELWQHSLHPAWLVLSGALYLLGLGFTATYWYRLLLGQGFRPPLPAALRAHYMGQLGKYLPGKAWALFLRSGVVRRAGVRVGVAVATSFYEVLTTMACGAMLAALLFALQAPDFSSAPDWPSAWRLVPGETKETTFLDPKLPALLALALVFPIGIPVIPLVFNRLVGRIAVPFRDEDSAPLPRFRVSCLLQGLVLSTGCWLLFGASVWAMLQGVMDQPPVWSWSVWGHCTAIMALAYVAGFVIVFVPSGLGVREFFLLLFLVPVMSAHLAPTEPGARSMAALAVILLRLVWTAAEVVMVGIVYWLPSSATGGPTESASASVAE